MKGPNNENGRVSSHDSAPIHLKPVILLPMSHFLHLQIVLMPNTEGIPIFQGPGIPEYMKNEYIRYRCRDLQLHVHRPELPELCRKHVFSISAVIHQTALGKVMDMP